ncbi:hypothetical protein [Marinifilum caeruleilacunae]|uniref:Lipocalin-like domain-containing protein n=1 Tax=Marinifilum caeruleilacunae TaxID=2499076 RepID=A0ABX1WU80_9BACT|nr:hypothetical protein [Marinifilum caeruleilacunae]NOU59655.1 hypothetical protein [Marinifilum caeruleilacunae]
MKHFKSLYYSASILLVTLGLLFLIGCEEEEQIESIIPDGTYIGTFQRELVWRDSDTANITITFSENSWNGTSDMLKYPGLQKGSYSIKGDSIVFTNGGFWTAEFDHTLLLEGKYLYKKSDHSIEFTRDYRSESADTFIDIYKLKKEE